MGVCCECGDEPSGSCATELVSQLVYKWFCIVWSHLKMTMSHTYLINEIRSMQHFRNLQTMYELNRRVLYSNVTDYYFGKKSSSSICESY
jgi:hypothetical protein